LCGVFPQEAEFITCYRDKEPGSPIELIRHDDRFILENRNFYYDCFKRPETGHLIGTVDEQFPDMEAPAFEELCRINGIEKPREPIVKPMAPCNFIAEPDGINRFDELPAQKPGSSVWQKLKAVFS